MDKTKRYKIIRKLRSDNFSTTYLARDTRISRKILLKTISSQKGRELASEEQRKVFFKAAKLSGKLIHPGIVTIYDAGMWDDSYFIVMEFIDAVTLEVYLRKTPLIPVNYAVDYAIQLGTALQFAHQKNVVHRFLSPATILITSDHRVKIMEFGTARFGITRHETSAGKTVGTPAYMAPEQIVGKAVDHRTDIYALGVILYQMLTGSKPFSGRNVSSIFHKILNSPPEEMAHLKQKIPEQLMKSVEQAMAKKPEERFDSMQKFVTALRKAKDLINLMGADTGISNAEESLGKLSVQNMKAMSHPTPDQDKIKVNVMENSEAAPRPKIKTVPLDRDAEKKYRRKSPKSDFSSDKKSGSGLIAFRNADSEAEAVENDAFVQSPAALIAPEVRHRKRKASKMELFLMITFIVVVLSFVSVVVFLFWGNASMILRIKKGSHLSPSATAIHFGASSVASPQGKSDGEARLQLSTQPAGVDLFLDGTYLGTTPFLGSSISPGKHTLTMRKEGFISQEQTIHLASGKLTTLNYTMQAQGILRVFTIPVHARISIDDKDLGQTPLEIPLPDRGPHKIRISKSGYLAFDSTFNITDLAIDKKLSYKLRKAAYGTVIVTSEVGNKVILDGTYKGTTPLRLRKVQVGRHELEIRNSIGKSKIKRITIREKRTTEVRHLFYPPGAIRISAVPFGTAFIDGDKKGITPLLLKNIPIGTHRIEIKKRGYKATSKVVKVQSNQEVNVFLTLEKNNQ